MTSLYLKLPYLIQCFIVNIVGYFNDKMKWNKRVVELISFYEIQDFKSIDEVSKKEIVNDDGSTRNKNACINNFESIFRKEHYKKDLFTSGTSGQAFRYPVSKEYLDNLWAIYWKFRKIHNVHHDDWFVYFVGKSIISTDKKRSPYWITSYFSKQLLMSQYHISNETVLEYLNKIKESRIKCIHAYPSTLFYFSQLIIENNLIDLARSCEMKFISVSSEKLSSHQKEIIEHVFSCRVVQLYGTTEGVINAFECEHGSLHIDEAFSDVRFTNVEGNKYRLSGSSYHNLAFPLVDYEINDEVIFFENYQCSCNRKSRVIKEVLGREDDYITLDSGAKVGRLDHIWKDTFNILEGQIIQYEDLSLKFKVVRKENYSKKDSDKLNFNIKEKLGSRATYEIIYVDKIPRTKSGKLKAVISYVK
ncbi:phenylacetate--CoA ligase family protein [Vibrio campbellii]|uniref:AMP-dependent synthetase/ligase domain-containing protein n=1 Tax=Vibrio campbellii (strain ATCC BAA-1116) TaxID=2902295 RepID=A7MSJ6_VIBC1|nr:phenylacetate--CoA ligase family protein [Vibrio campbellii]ABU69698.1 hypothetical protein VIBHAR_00696 [Vibrio campbellii ATCC BAA-1116]AGU96583.1 hypothetical protein M892_09365 [Vibrio campbellii ATCC BAA-1116]MBT0120111.1 phenylacetate--CoA ligase family protein [Vibrio campbellii]MBT0135022.1 phenylacetate--CoA ligase family protein [Vibrio campbellii]MBT0139702.1 phenylacetate--CoA ligase family protein [Vibrio campbellii]